MPPTYKQGQTKAVKDVNAVNSSKAVKDWDKKTILKIEPGLKIKVVSKGN